MSVLFRCSRRASRLWRARHLATTPARTGFSAPVRWLAPNRWSGPKLPRCRFFLRLLKPRLRNVPAAPVLSPEAKAAAFAELRARALACVKCPNLASSRKNVVFGVGNIDAPVMFVGEAPGADEDEQGEPFVGKAGQLLTKIIQAMGLQRETVYIANILKCRPDTPGQDRGQSQAHAGGNANVHSVSARAD